MIVALWITFFLLAAPPSSSSSSSVAATSTPEPTTPIPEQKMVTPMEGAEQDTEPLTTPTTEEVDESTVSILQPRYKRCKNDTDCQQHKFERCRKYRQGDTGKCTCMAGYSWTSDRKSCTAVKYYKVMMLLTKNEFGPELEDRSTPEFRYMEYQAREGIYRALEASKLNSILVGAKSYCGFQNSTDGYVVLSFKMKLSRSYAPEEAEVRQDIIDGIKSVLEEEGSNETRLSDTIILIDENELSSMQIMAPDPCSSGWMNYCDQSAECLSVARSFSCRCKEGYADTSFNQKETPGEKCELLCDCSDFGRCMHTEDKGVHCQCQGWYLGKKCDIDGKLLLIIMCAILGALLLIGIVCCWCCMYKMKKTTSESDDNTSMTTLDRQRTDSFTKSPYSWANTWRYYNFTPSYPMSNPYATWAPQSGGTARGSTRHSRVEPYPGTVMLYPSDLSIPRPHVAPVGHNSAFYY